MCPICRHLGHKYCTLVLDGLVMGHRRALGGDVPVREPALAQGKYM